MVRVKDAEEVVEKLFPSITAALMLPTPAAVLQRTVTKPLPELSPVNSAVVIRIQLLEVLQPGLDCVEVQQKHVLDSLHLKVGVHPSTSCLSEQSCVLVGVLCGLYLQAVGHKRSHARCKHLRVLSFGLVRPVHLEQLNFTAVVELRHHPKRPGLAARCGSLASYVEKLVRISQYNGLNWLPGKERTQLVLDQAPTICDPSLWKHHRRRTPPQIRICTSRHRLLASSSAILGLDVNEDALTSKRYAAKDRVLNHHTVTNSAHNRRKRPAQHENVNKRQVWCNHDHVGAGCRVRTIVRDLDAPEAHRPQDRTATKSEYPNPPRTPAREWSIKVQTTSIVRHFKSTGDDQGGDASDLEGENQDTRTNRQQRQTQYK
mmetsp:Transcript_35172/g.93751  ORF Transcript_35172/g.93751 Transcript_35172/m.93751 type:complete len:374 (-) Transcript_35172:31-1152(-)